MNRIPSAKRQGLTLLEVLITIFVMAIGFLSVLTLFPLAARKIIRSIDSDRATLISGNSTVALNILGFKNDAQQIFDNDLATINADPKLAALKSKRSRYIHIDPIASNGGYDSPTYDQFSFLKAPSVTLKKFDNYRDLLISQDEMQFTADGKPEDGFRRGQRYSTSFLFSRGQLNDRESINCLVLVYVGRPVESGVANILEINPSGATNGSLEFNLKDLPNNGPDREFGRNSWIMDISPAYSLGSYVVPQNKRFYQVQSVKSVDGQFKVCLDKPIQCEGTAATTGITKAIWIDYLFDVFDRGTGE